MATYDKEQKDENELTPEGINQREQELGSHYDTHDHGPLSKYSRDKRKDSQHDLREASDNQDEKEWNDLNQKIGEMGGLKKPDSETSEQEKAGPGDDENEGGGLYKPGDDKKRRFGFRGGKARTSGGLKKRLLQAGAAGGVLGVIGTLGIFGSFLNTFRMDHALKNIDKKANSRLSASLDVRNKYLMRSYIKARATEFENNADHENLFFKANKVSDGHPMQDWYRTLRKNGFEEDVFNKSGIAFVSVVDKDGNINTAKLTQNKDLDPQFLKDKGLDNISPSDTKTFLAKVNNLSDEDLQKVFTVDIHDSHHAARADVHAVVNANIPWFRTFKRRQIRKDIKNVTGIKNWRLFEKTRDAARKKIQSGKFYMYNKIIDKVYSSNPNTGALLKCLFSDGKCATSSDPESPSAHGNPSGVDDGLNNPDTSPEPSTDSNGKPTTTDTPLDTAQAGNDAAAAASETAGAQATDAAAKGLTGATAEKFDNASASKKLVWTLISKMTGKGLDEVISDSIPDPGKITTIWTWLKRVAKIDDLLGKGKDSKLSKMVKNARRAQLIGVLATYSIANDQMKSGQLTSDELNDFFATTSNLGNSEGWGVVSGQITPDQAKANSPQKQAYCDENYQPKPNDFAYFCDSKRPDSGGRAESLSNAYTNTIGHVISPVASVVNAVDKNVIGQIFDKLTGAISGVEKIVSQPLTDALKNSGLLNGIQDVAGTLMGKLMDFLGAGPIMDTSGNDVGNLLVAGGVAQAESSARASGGAIPPSASAKAASDQLAANYLAEQRKSESFKDRYLSLDSPDSVASTALFAVSSTPFSSLVTKVGSAFSSLPHIFGSAITGKLFAQSTDSTDLTSWAGVDRYDVPGQCINFDPTSPLLDSGANYYNGTNYYNVTGQKDLDFTNIQDNDKFYQKVYDWVNSQPDPEAAGVKAESIYNCWILDARARGNLGFTYGYNQDAGYDPGSGSSSSGSSNNGTTAASSSNLYLLGDSYTVGMKSHDVDNKLQQKGWKVTSTGLVGRHLNSDSPDPGGVKQLDQDKAAVQGAGLIVVELGTNDLGNVGPGLQAVYDKIKSLNTSASIVWVNYYVNTVADHGQAASDTLNTFAKDKSIKVLDWHTNGPPAYANSPDGIHPGDYNALVDFVVGQIGQAPPSSSGSGQ